MNKVYLGDSVYAEYDGSVLVLTTYNGLPDDPSNLIYIEPEVYAALMLFSETHQKRIKAQMENEPQT